MCLLDRLLIWLCRCSDAFLMGIMCSFFLMFSHLLLACLSGYVDCREKFAFEQDYQGSIRAKISIALL